MMLQLQVSSKIDQHFRHFGDSHIGISILDKNKIFLQLKMKRGRTQETKTRGEMEKKLIMFLKSILGGVDYVSLISTMHLHELLRPRHEQPLGGLQQSPRKVGTSYIVLTKV